MFVILSDEREAICVRSGPAGAPGGPRGLQGPSSEPVCGMGVLDSPVSFCSTLSCPLPPVLLPVRSSQPSQTCLQVLFDLTPPSLLIGQGQSQGQCAGDELGACGPCYKKTTGPQIVSLSGRSLSGAYYLIQVQFQHL